MTDSQHAADGAEDSTLTDQSANPSPGRHPDITAAAAMHRRSRSLRALGNVVGCGLAFLGLVAAILALLEPQAASETGLAALARRLLRAGWMVVAFGLAGWVSSVFVRLKLSVLDELRERASRRSGELRAGLDQVNMLLERIAEGLEKRAEPRISQAALDVDRAIAISEIEASIASSRWALAESQIGAFKAAYPGDSKSALLQTTLEERREGALHERMAELKAAREVNDPSRVLELYQVIAPALEAEHRSALQTEVAQWFLSLIYRRLRMGKVQVDVVELAARFAECFAATIEGASVQAALPTLRRSAGLCPRCGQPFTGVAQACPRCLRKGAAVGVLLPSVEPTEPE